MYLFWVALKLIFDLKQSKINFTQVVHLFKQAQKVKKLISTYKIVNYYPFQKSKKRQSFSLFENNVVPFEIKTFIICMMYLVVPSEVGIHILNLKNF